VGIANYGAGWRNSQLEWHLRVIKEPLLIDGEQRNNGVIQLKNGHYMLEGL
jgi:hypothetical protein